MSVLPSKSPALAPTLSSPAPTSAREDRNFDQFLREVQPKLAQILARYRIPAQDAEDVLQETLLTYVHKYDEVRNPEAWLVVTLRNRCLIYWRRKRKQFYQAVDTAILELLSEPEAPSQQRAELHYDLERLIAHLPDRCQSLLKLRYGLGCSSIEVADRMGYRQSSIRKVTSRCLHALTKELLRSGFNPLPVLDEFESARS
ncbi:MAG TPA: sigma-70 family RNA polymerase sigma factor [Thermoanaerobaculia bacterium]|nr:sigma-70 family RNA polymerase sigma factor [Thermoanaerobaculia bacterium]